MSGTEKHGKRSEVQYVEQRLTNSNRAFIYRQSNVSNGQFTLVVPYSTEGPIAGGTNFDTKLIRGLPAGR